VNAACVPYAPGNNAHSSGRGYWMATDASHVYTFGSARYFGDKDLNEDWVTASLRAFHDPEQDGYTQRYLVPALDSLPWIQQNRRIFFLGNWVSATLDGQRSEQALAAVDDMLRRRAGLARDLREKILQSRDELERTVEIRRAFP